MNKISTPSANLEFVREDDYVEYFLFPQLTKIGGSFTDNELREELVSIQEKCLAIVKQKSLERGYIWHKDAFQLQARTCSADERLLNDEINLKENIAPVLPPHLHGVTHYGENIQDEWYIVYLLTELTRVLNGCIARVCDVDGEFLLIEAADALPDWASPDVCEQRVYIVNGHLQLVQNSPTPNAGKGLTVIQAVAKIRLNPTLYRVSSDIQTCIENRLSEFVPPQPIGSLHRQIVQLPLSAGILLKQRPDLIAAATRAFCDRDLLDTKALRTMRYFPPEAPRIRTNVAFTRCLYAMIMHSEYMPDRRIGWNLSNSKNNTNTTAYKEQLLGIKLASGLEILATQAKKVESIEFTETPAWRVYYKSLQDKGYFHSKLEGSQEYKRLLETAENFFKNQLTRFRTNSLVGAEILEMLRGDIISDINAESIRDAENNIQPSDSDDWLNINAEELDAMLLERYGGKNFYKKSDPVNAETFTKQLSDFLDKESNIEGVEPHDKLNSSDDDDNEINTADLEAQSSSSSITVNHNKNANFKSKIKKNKSLRRALNAKNNLLNESNDILPECASTHVRNFLDFVIPEDNWDSNSEMSDYEDESDLERNFDAMSANVDFNIDQDIQKYMAQMDRELSATKMGQTFNNKKQKYADNPCNIDSDDYDDDNIGIDDNFDDIESFKPININVNTLKNMLDSYKSQAGGSGPVSNLFSAMGIGMSAEVSVPLETTSAAEDETQEVPESLV